MGCPTYMLGPGVRLVEVLSAWRHRWRNLGPGTGDATPHARVGSGWALGGLWPLRCWGGSLRMDAVCGCSGPMGFRGLCNFSMSDWGVEGGPPGLQIRSDPKVAWTVSRMAGTDQML